jgi:hypothetical protein
LEGTEIEAATENAAIVNNPPPQESQTQRYPSPWSGLQKEERQWSVLDDQELQRAITLHGAKISCFTSPTGWFWGLYEDRIHYLPWESLMMLQ